MQEKGNIVIMKLVSDSLMELLTILEEEEYFSYEENIVDYVKGILLFMYSVPKNKHWRETKNKKYGKWCCRYSPNKHASWYVTFDFQDDIFILKFITNNHTAEYDSIIGKRK